MAVLPDKWLSEVYNELTIFIPNLILFLLVALKLNLLLDDQSDCLQSAQPHQVLRIGAAIYERLRIVGQGFVDPTTLVQAETLAV